MATIRPDWWRYSFGRSYIKQYKWQEQWTKLQVDFVRRHANGKQLLDVGCGYGRISIPLSTQFLVTGIDYSADLLKEAKRRARNTSSITFMIGDMRNLKKSLKNSTSFDVVISMFTSFGYFSDRENIKTLEECSRVLKKGGILILDLTNPLPQEIQSHTKNKRLVFDRAQNPGSVRLYTKTEISRLVKKAGFNRFIFFGGYKDEPYNKTSPRLIVVANKG